jgi:transmembrane sensor
MKQHGSESTDHACDAALGWIARLRSDTATVQDQQAFALWLGEHRSHRDAMDQMLAMWDELGVVAELPAEKPAEAANSARWVVGAAALAASIALAVVFWPALEDSAAPIHFQTALGEQRSVSLADKTRVVLNTDSSISVSYTDDQRHITLQRGEAWFDVTPNKQRPFHVDAGDARVTAIGTAFNVYLDGPDTDVIVTEGVVRVSELGETGNRAPTTEVLRENERLRTGDNGWHVAAAEDLSGALAWQRGELVAREMPLPELLRQLERYHADEILIVDPDLAVLTVSGVFDLKRPEAILSALALSLDLQVDRVDAATVRLLKADQ